MDSEKWLDEMAGAAEKRVLLEVSKIIEKYIAKEAGRAGWIYSECLKKGFEQINTEMNNMLSKMIKLKLLKKKHWETIEHKCQEIVTRFENAINNKCKNIPSYGITDGTEDFKKESFALIKSFIEIQKQELNFRQNEKKFGLKKNVLLVVIAAVISAFVKDLYQFIVSLIK